MQDLHALFTGEDDTWEAWLVFDTGPKLGSNTIKLRRGFSSSGYVKPSQVNHYVNVFCGLFFSIKSMIAWRMYKMKDESFLWITKVIAVRSY
jgi:hypothetical protein